MEQLILRTDELDNAIDYLEKVIFYYKNRKDKYWFKWLMISLHGALYGIGVCAVRGTNPTLRVLDDPSKKQIQKIIPILSERFLGIEDPISKDHNEILADEHMLMALKILAENNLNNIWNILDKCENPNYMLQNIDSKVLEKKPKQNIAIEKMINYRNDFAHFKPKISGITKSEEWIIKEVVDVIKFLALESNNVFYKTNENKERTEALLTEFYEGISH